MNPRRPLLGVLACPVLFALAFATVGCKPAAEAPLPAPAPGEWREFQGSWNAAGTRRSIPLGAERRSSIIDLRGSLLLRGAGRPGVGFRWELIALADSESGMIGRSVWTDERGDQVFSELRGESIASKTRIAGTIVGGTGRYAGATGSYEFAWHFVIEAADGSIQGSTDGLEVRVRFGQPGAGSSRP